jgi:hypothetical protein
MELGPHAYLETAGSPEDDERPQVADVGRLMRRGVRGAVRAARRDEKPTLPSLIRGHFPGGVDDLGVVEETWAAYDHVNVQAGLDAWLDEPARTHRLVGVSQFMHHEFGLGDLLTRAGHGWGPQPGNVMRTNLPSGPDGQVQACIQCAVYLVADGDIRTALLLRGPERESMQERVSLHLVSDAPGHAEATAAEIRRLALEHNVYRGQVLSFGGEMFSPSAVLQFHPRPTLSADQLILPPGTLEAVDRQVVGLGRHKQRLLAAGQHLKRGVLLYGPPGTGKTHTLRYLLGQLQGVTVVQLTGTSVDLVAEACSVARALQPAVVVIEDVDLIAEDRGDFPGRHPLLFQLLNEMDGLAEDSDVAFVLTTNRADLLESALTSRPGRVDQAVELTLPNADSRRALLELYSREVALDTSRLDAVIARTDGVTASFLKELVRRACLLAAERTDPGHGDGAAALAVSADDLDTAVAELLDTRNAMTRLLLGGQGDPQLPRSSD